MDHDAESCEVWEMWVGEFGEGEFGEGRDSECSESGKSGVVMYSEPEGSLYIPTPDRPRTVVRPIDLPARLCFIELSYLGSFISTVNTDVHHVGMQGKFSSCCSSKVSWPWGCHHS